MHNLQNLIAVASRPNGGVHSDDTVYSYFNVMFVSLFFFFFGCGRENIAMRRSHPIPDWLKRAFTFIGKGGIGP